MAIPTLTLNSAAAFRPSYQDYLSKTRQMEHENRAKWADHAKYFQNNQVTCIKNNQWGSEQSFHHSLETFAAEQMQEIQKENLVQRRNLLKQLLEAEENLYRQELQSIIDQSGNQMFPSMPNTPGRPMTDRSVTAPNLSSRVEHMRRRVEELQSAREEKRKEVARSKLYQHWRDNNADIRDMESEQMQKHVVGEWAGQVQTRRVQLEEEQMRKRQEEEEIERQRLLALQMMADEEARKKQAARDVGDDLVQQMEQLRMREQEANDMKSEQDRLMREQWELQKLDSQRSALEKERAKYELGRFLVQQYRAQLRRRFEQQRIERQQDIQILEHLQALQEQEADEKTERQRSRLEEIREAVDAARAKQLADKESEQELDLIYRDEAERVWRKRETEWATEQAARANLMQLVLDERSQQVKQKLVDLEIARKQNVEEREIALKEMEMLKLQSEAELYEKEEEKVHRKEELQSAITARREAAISARLQMEQELQMQKHQEQAMKEMVEEERRVISQRGYQPKSYAILKQKPVATNEDELQLENLESFDQFTTPRGGGAGSAMPTDRNQSHINTSARPYSNSQQRHFINNIWGGQVPPPS